MKKTHISDKLIELFLFQIIDIFSVPAVIKCDGSQLISKVNNLIEKISNESCN